MLILICSPIWEHNVNKVAPHSYTLCLSLINSLYIHVIIVEKSPAWIGLGERGGVSSMVAAIMLGRPQTASLEFSRRNRLLDR
jgi:hypothetical protein